MSEKALLIFIKNPQKGKVKTRLAEGVGDEKALRIYKKLLDYTRQVSLGVEADRQVWYSRYVSQNDEWDANRFAKRQQQDGTLGYRMQHAFKSAFENGYEKAVIIGSDCGQLREHHINHAFEVLEEHDVVIGPARDGGYYLLGMSRFIPVLFEDKLWSTEKVLGQTVEDCRVNDLSYHLLEELNDVDTEADWEEVKDRF